MLLLFFFLNAEERRPKRRYKEVHQDVQFGHSWIPSQQGEFFSRDTDGRFPPEMFENDRIFWSKKNCCRAQFFRYDYGDLIACGNGSQHFTFLSVKITDMSICGACSKQKEKKLVLRALPCLDARARRFFFSRGKSADWGSSKHDHPSGRIKSLNPFPLYSLRNSPLVHTHA